MAHGAEVVDQRLEQKHCIQHAVGIPEEAVPCHKVANLQMAMFFLSDIMI
jgi:hypothetical protein